MEQTGKTAKGWNILEKDGAILWREYKFRPGATATTFVFRGAGDGLIVVSPGCDVEPGALDELSDFGNVVALVASNAYHWLGQPVWRKRFPGSRSFAPKQGIKRITKMAPELGTVESLDALAPLLGDRATVAEAPGLKVGNAFATVHGKNGAYFYPSDFLANMQALPPNFVVRTLMSMTDSAPGYRLFRPSVWLQVKDKPALRAWLESEVSRSEPATVVPAHGLPFVGPDVVGATRALLARL